MRTISIGTDDHCRSLGSLLRSSYFRAPASYLKQLTRTGKICINGRPAEFDQMLRRGDTVSVRESGRLLQFQAAGAPFLDILHEDERILVVNKPAGLAVHRTTEDGEDTLLDRAKRYFVEGGVPVTPRPVNRLDRGTSGVVLLAKGGAAAGMFGRMVKETGLEKFYLAVAEGELSPEGVVDLPVDGKESVTRYRRLLGGRGWCVAALWPLTGRMHQIRRHLAAAGAPVMGDRRYGSRTLLSPGVFCLHSFSTSFVHPETGRRMTCVAPLPSHFTAMLDRLAFAETGTFLDQIADMALVEPQQTTSQGEVP